MGLAANWQISMSYASITMAAGRFGGRCLRTVWAGSVQYCLSSRSLSAPTSTFSFGLAVQMSAFSASPFVWLLDPTGAYQFCLRTDSLGNLIACRASARNAQTDLGRTGAPVLHANTWHYIEVEGVIGDSGAVRVYVDGAKVLDLAGVDTQQQANAQIGIIQLGYSNSSATYLFDDLYVIDSAAPGRAQDHRAHPHRRRGKSLHPSTGTDNFACLDEAVPDTTDYVTASAPAPPTPMNWPIWHAPGGDRRHPAHRARPQDRRGHPRAGASGGLGRHGRRWPQPLPRRQLHPGLAHPAPRPGNGRGLDGRSGQRPARGAQGHRLMADEYVVASLAAGA
jgi:hypothetical protein